MQSEIIPIKTAILPMDCGQIVLSWPRSISKEDAEDIEAFLLLVLKKMKREATLKEQKKE